MQAAADSELSVRAGARLHFGLLDLAGVTGRLYGGIGCMLAQPCVEMSGTLSAEIKIEGLDLDDELQVALSKKLKELTEALGARPIRLRLTQRLPPHLGFGSSTATVLAAMSLLVRLNRLDVPAERLAALSGRGGVSGTGVHGFFTGGWVVDAGQPPGTTVGPSRFSRHEQPSLLVGRIAPPDWPVGLFLAPGKAMSGEAEAEFFRANASRAATDAHRCVAVAHHKLVPGLLTGDLQLVADGVSELSACGFKASELSNQPLPIHQLIERLRQVSPVVGMSSMGPLVYAIGGDIAQWRDIALEKGAWHIATKVSPSPAEFKWQN